MSSKTQTIRICVTGAKSAVGTTSLIHRFVHDEFTSNPPVSYNPAALRFKVNRDRIQKVRVLVNDVSVRQNHQLRILQFELANLIFITVPASGIENTDFEACLKLILAHSRVPIAVIGCQSDTTSSTKFNGVALATSHDCFGYFETSSLTGQGVKDAFIQGIHRVLFPPSKKSWFSFLKGQNIPSSVISRENEQSSTTSSNNPIPGTTRKSINKFSKNFHTDAPKPSVPPNTEDWMLVSKDTSNINSSSSIPTSFSLSPAENLDNTSAHSMPSLEKGPLSDRQHSSAFPDLNSASSTSEKVSLAFDYLNHQLTKQEKSMSVSLNQLIKSCIESQMLHFRCQLSKGSQSLRDHAMNGNDSQFALVQTKLAGLEFPSISSTMKILNLSPSSFPSHIPLNQFFYFPTEIPVDFNPPEPVSGNTPLHLAAKFNHPKIIKIILYGSKGLFSPSSATSSSAPYNTSYMHFNSSQKTAIDLALEYNSPQAYYLLANKQVLTCPPSGNIPQREHKITSLVQSDSDDSDDDQSKGNLLSTKPSESSTSPVHELIPPTNAPTLAPSISIGSVDSPSTNGKSNFVGGLKSLALVSSKPQIHTHLQINQHDSRYREMWLYPKLVFFRHQWKKFKSLGMEIAGFLGMDQGTRDFFDPKEVGLFVQQSPLYRYDKSFVQEGSLEQSLSFFESLAPLPIAGLLSFDYIPLLKSLFSLRNNLKQKRSLLESRLLEFYLSFQTSQNAFIQKDLSLEKPSVVSLLQKRPWEEALKDLKKIQSKIFSQAFHLSKSTISVTMQEILVDPSKSDSLVQELSKLVAKREHKLKMILKPTNKAMETCKQLASLAQYAGQVLLSLLTALKGVHSSSLSLNLTAQKYSVPNSPRSGGNEVGFALPLVESIDSPQISSFLSMAETSLTAHLASLRTLQNDTHMVAKQFTKLWKTFVSDPSSEQIENLISEAENMDNSEPSWSRCLETDTSGFGGFEDVIPSTKLSPSKNKSNTPFPLLSPLNTPTSTTSGIPTLESASKFLESIAIQTIREVEYSDIPNWNQLLEFVTSIIQSWQDLILPFKNSPVDSDVSELAKTYSLAKQYLWKLEDEYFDHETSLRIRMKRGLSTVNIETFLEKSKILVQEQKDILAPIQSRLYKIAFSGRPEVLAILPQPTYSSTFFDPSRHFGLYTVSQNLVCKKSYANQILVATGQPNTSTIVPMSPNPVVLKQFNLLNEHNRSAFSREVAGLELVPHPFIIPINCIFVSQDAETAFLEVPYYPSGSLYHSIFESSSESISSGTSSIQVPPKKTSIPTKIRYLRDILVALAYVHSKGLVHGNISTTNIYIDQSGSPRMSGFHQCQAISAHSRTHLDLANVPSILLQPLTGNIIDPIYSSPELCSNSSNMSQSSDMWSFGIVALEILAQSKSSFDSFIQSRKDLDYCFSNSDSTTNRNILEFLTKILVIDPKKRITANEALAHPVFNTNPLADLGDLDYNDIVDLTESAIVASSSSLSTVPMSGKNILISGDVRWKLFKTLFDTHSRKIRDLASQYTKNVTVTRKDLIRPVLDALRACSYSQCHNLRIKVKFSGEIGVDGGGLNREMLTIFFGASPSQRQVQSGSGSDWGSGNQERTVDYGVFHPSHKLFETNPDTGKALPVLDSKLKAPGQTKDLVSFGKLLAVCLINGFTVADLPLAAPAFYKILWHGPDSPFVDPKTWQLKDLETFTGPLTGLRQAMAWQDPSILEACMFSFVPKGSSTEVDVTMENRLEYYHTYIWDQLIRSRKKAWEAIYEGFSKTMTDRSISNGLFPTALKILMTPVDLAILLGATGRVDVELLISTYLLIESSWGGSKTDPTYTPNIVKNWLRTTTQANIQKFLYFVTASTSLPNNPRTTTVRKVIVKKASGSVDRLPTAATCSLTLYCPDYRNAAKFSKNIELAMSADDYGNR